MRLLLTATKFHEQTSEAVFRVLHAYDADCPVQAQRLGQSDEEIDRAETQALGSTASEAEGGPWSILSHC